MSGYRGSLMLDAKTIPVIVGLVLIIAIMLPTILLWITYRKYKRVAAALPDAEAVGGSDHGAKHARLTARLLQDWKAVPEDELEMARHALWTAMLLEAAADASIDNREMQFISALFGRMAGEKMDFAPVITAAELVQRDRRSALRELGKAKRISNESKQQVLAGAFLVSVADHELAPQETDCLVKIADALGLNTRERKAMLQEITRRFEG